MNSINEQLEELYSSKWTAIRKALREIVRNDSPPSPTNPLLICIEKEKEWKKADLRVMIFGQETNHWEDLSDHQSIKSIRYRLKNYNRFYNNGDCWSYGGHFWNGFARFTNILNAKYPDKQIRYVWNNIVKIGKDHEAGRPPKNIYDAEREFFHVIPDEVKILKPDIILFLTGPNYDDVIRDNFGELAYSPVSPYSERQLAKVVIPSIRFAFRTYHPNYLFRNDIDSYFRAIVKRIKITT
jgi:hypothetical protein